jgi:hypothetical protein
LRQQSFLAKARAEPSRAEDQGQRKEPFPSEWSNVESGGKIFSSYGNIIRIKRNEYPINGLGFGCIAEYAANFSLRGELAAINTLRGTHTEYTVRKVSTALELFMALDPWFDKSIYVKRSAECISVSLRKEKEWI